MAVCQYCQTLIAKDAESVKDLGKISQVIEDFSLIQIGSSGKFENRQFTVVGRIQLRYERGVWNEWYLYFDDGEPGWLSDSDGRYLITLPQGPCPSAPAFDSLGQGSNAACSLALKPDGGAIKRHLSPDTTLAPLSSWNHAGRQWMATDVRTAQCTGGQGELPFRVGDGWTARVADFRSEDDFLTLDFSESTPPQLYQGRFLLESELPLQNLRAVDEIGSAAGTYKGKVQALGCPSCGGVLRYRMGVATHVVCGSCQASVDCTSDQSIVLQAADRLAGFESSATFRLGDRGTLLGRKYEVIGFMRRGVPGAPMHEHWMEYLLLSGDSLLWLVCAEEKWQIYQSSTLWPTFNPQMKWLRLEGQPYVFKEAYRAQVMQAVGAFNWRVHVGDVCQVNEYVQSGHSLSLEYNAYEASCSIGKPISWRELSEAFSLAKGTTPVSPRWASGQKEVSGDEKPLLGAILPIAKSASALFLMFAFGMWIGRMADLGDAFWVSTFVLSLLWFPWLVKADYDEF